MGRVAEAQCVTAGDACDDGEYCTVGDMCDSMLTCVGSARDCDDGRDCTDDTCDEAGDTCANPPSPAGEPCGDGQYCTVNDTCDGSGSCNSGGARDCDDGRGCTTDTCDEADNECDNVLQGGRCLVGSSCRSDGETNSSDPCEVCDPGASTTGWSPAPVGTRCGASSCAMGEQIDRVCDDSGSCTSAMTPCGFGTCHDATFCATCRVDADCPDGAYCSATECVLAAPSGSVCDRDRRCISGECVEGLCCDTACDGPCEACDALLNRGTCTPFPAGTDPQAACGTSTCDGLGGCMTDAGMPPGDASDVVAHGSGCIACTVGATNDDRTGLAVSLLTGLFVFLRRRRFR